MKAWTRTAVMALGVMGSIASIIGLWSFFDGNEPRTFSWPDQRSQVHTGSGDNIQVGGDLHIEKGVPDSLVVQWTQATQRQTAELAQQRETIEQLIRDYTAFREDVLARSAHEAELLKVLDNLSSGDIIAAEQRLARLLEQQVRISRFAEAAETANMIGRLKALQLDQDGVEKYEQQAEGLRHRVRQEADLEDEGRREEVPCAPARPTSTSENAEDCERGSSPEASAQENSDAEIHAIPLNHKPNVALGKSNDLVMVAMGQLERGMPDAALTSLLNASELGADPDQQVEIHAQIYLNQKRLHKAISAIEIAFDHAAVPVPDWVMDLRRTIDVHPDRDQLSAAQIETILSDLSTHLRGSETVPALDLYIPFDIDSAQPTDQGLAQIIELSDALEVRSNTRVEESYRIIGHTDKTGGSAYNQQLSERRAEAVQRIVEARYPRLAGTLMIDGRGETEPKYRGNTAEDRSLNRRMEIQVLLGH